MESPFKLTNEVAFAGIKLPPKVIAVSYSKLKNFKSCPKRHFHYDIAKDVKEEKSEQLAYGDDVHGAMHVRIAKNTPLPPMLQHFEPWVTKFMSGADQPGTQFLVEQKFAVKADFTPCGYFDKGVLWRSIADAIKIRGPIAVNWDWKTGKPKEEPMQIITAAACLMAHYPELKLVRNEFIWLEHGFTSRVDLKREDLPKVWANVMPAIQEYQEAHRTMTFPPIKNGLCKNYCSVVSCPHYGGGG